jgi:hypothetical protein
MDEEDLEYTADMALEDAQEEAQKGLKALERADFHLDDNAPAEVFEALEEVHCALTRITWL